MGVTFEYDNQTFDDLQILNENQEASVFSLFNNTLTEGGSDYLKHLIKSPITDSVELGKRLKLIRFFINNPVKLSISSKQLKYIEKYINLNVTVLKSNPFDLLYLRFTEWLSPSNDYYLLKTGCENLIQVLHELNKKLSFDVIPKELLENTQIILELIENLKHDLDSKSEISWIKTTKLDRIFRIKYSKKLKSLLEEIYFIDAYTSIALTASKNSFALPEYEHSSKPILFAKELKHPLLKNAVSNDIEISLKENMCFLTGPNMAGKSTFLKSIGICIFLAHLGFPVPAKEFKTSIYSGIITTINLSDNLNIGYSHFYSEVQRVKEAARTLADGKKMFVIFDELFRGTNVKDAFEASTEIIKGFAKIENCTFFMSTHIVEIAEEIKNKSTISFKYFNSDLDDNTLKYSYKLKKGVSSQRLGMHILKKEGVFDLLKSITPAKK
jgi:DNA mismatch repair ATPase MutS